MTDALSPRERLNRLLALAAQGAQGRVALLDELVDLLADWPADYAQAMRGTFEALLEKTAREADAETRAKLAGRLAAAAGVPVELLNAFYFEAPPALRARILARNADAADRDAVPPAASGMALVAAARTTVNGTFAQTFAATLHLPPALAHAILADPSGEALAVACRGAGLDRACFSALAILTGDAGAARLRAFDAIPPAGAARLLDHWRTQRD
jgi:hypothetical protein